jgi:hypothetical protein
MPRNRRPGPLVGTDEWRQRVSAGVARWHARRRELARVVPSELLELEKSGTVQPSLRPYAAQAIEEADALARALGGTDAISEQRLVLLQDAARIGILIRALLARFLESGADGELATKIGTLVGTRRGLLASLGLERACKELSLHDYLAQKAEASEDRAQGTNGDDPDTLPTSAASNAPRGNEGGVLEVFPGPPAVAPNTDSTERPSGAQEQETP